MNNRNIHRIFLFVLLALMVISISAVLAAVNIVPTSLSTDYSTALTANLIKPTQCANLSLSTVINCVSTVQCNGSSGNDLMLGDAANNKIRAGDGNDCIVGGAGNDNIDGQGGTDVCIGGPGTDTFGGGCETKIQ